MRLYSYTYCRCTDDVKMWLEQKSTPQYNVEVCPSTSRFYVSVCPLSDDIKLNSISIQYQGQTHKN